jgi:hypothetical protein
MINCNWFAPVEVTTITLQYSEAIAIGQGQSKEKHNHFRRPSPTVQFRAGNAPESNFMSRHVPKYVHPLCDRNKLSTEPTTHHNQQLATSKAHAHSHTEPDMQVQHLLSQPPLTHEKRQYETRRETTCTLTEVGTLADHRLSLIIPAAY